MTAVQTSRWIAAQATALAVVLLAALVAALTLQAPAPLAADTLRLAGAASQAAADAGSYRMDMTVSVEASGLTIDVAGTAEMVAATGAGRGELEVPGGTTLRFLSTGERGFFELPEGSSMRSGGKTWVSFPLPAGGAGLTEDPLDLLRLLTADGEVQDLGGEEVNGVDVRHYRAELDAGAMADLADLQSENPLIGNQLRQLDGTGRLDLWLDDEDLPRRMRVEVEARDLTVVFAFELSDYGLDVDVMPPPAAEVIEVGSQAEAGGLLGG